MSAHSRLTQREIQAILKRSGGWIAKRSMGGEVVATAGEILAEEEEGDFRTGFRHRRHPRAHGHLLAGRGGPALP